MKTYQSRFRSRRPDGRKGTWIKLRHPSEVDPQSKTEMYRWAAAWSDLRWHNPELFKRVGAYLCDKDNQLRKEYLELKYPPEPTPPTQDVDP